jgi:hypothetical protein
MSARSALLLATLVVCGACGSSRRPHMYPAGSDRDDGYGDLAQKSARLLIGDGSDAPLAPHHRRRPPAGAYGGDPYGGAVYAGGGDDDDPSADDLLDPRSGSPSSGSVPGSSSRYTAEVGLTGAIEGTVTWRGAVPPPLTTACGAVAGVRIAPDRGVGGVLVYIEHVEVGRTLPTLGRPIGVGGIIAKRGCALGPAIQILTPLPAELAIHGDATEARLRITLPGGPRVIDLQPAGRLVVPAQPGITRIEADDGSLGAAWVLASSTPYYAITDDRGRFRIDELAAGTYELTFWRPPLATLRGGKLIYGAPAIVHRSVRVDATRPARLDLAVP